MTKNCSKCNKNKPLDNFYKDNRNGGRRYSCIQCCKEYTEKTKEIRSKKAKERYALNKEKVKQRVKRYAEDNKEAIKARAKKYREDNKEKISEGKKKCYEAKKDQYKEKNREYRRINEKTIKEYSKEYRRKNRERLSKKSTEHTRKKRKEDPLFRLKMQLNHRIRQSVTNKYKNTKDIVGLEMKDLVEYLTKDLPNDFSWRDYHIDHICPCSQATTEEELYKLQHFSNLRLVPAEDNLKKSNKLTPEGEKLCLELLNREAV